MLEEVGWRPGERPLAYVCGPTRLVEAVAGHLVALGHDPRGSRPNASDQRGCHERDFADG